MESHKAYANARTMACEEEHNAYDKSINSELVIVYQGGHRCRIPEMVSALAA